MVSKKELLEEIETLGAALESERQQHLVTDRARARYARDNDAYRAREAARIRSDRAAEQRKRQEAEREDKRKRRQELSDGMLRIADAHAWSFDHEVGEAPVLHLSVTLDADTYPIARGVIDKLNAPNSPTHAQVLDEWQRTLAERLNIPISVFG